VARADRRLSANDRLTGRGILLYLFAGACWLPVVGIQIEMRRIVEGEALPARYFTLSRTWFLLPWPAFSDVVVTFWLSLRTGHDGEHRHRRFGDRHYPSTLRTWHGRLVERMGPAANIFWNPVRNSVNKRPKLRSARRGVNDGIWVVPALPHRSDWPSSTPDVRDVYCQTLTRCSGGRYIA
jgi:hypothetical protein